MTVKLLFICSWLTMHPLVNVPVCSCDGQQSTLDAVNSADFVFKGTAISKDISSNLKMYGIKIIGDTLSYAYRFAKNPVAIYQIKVDKIFKGIHSSDTMTIITPVNSPACGFPFNMGEEYIVYATKNDGTIPGNKIKRISTSDKVYWTHLCMRTASWNEDDENEILKNR